jgi:elongation factor Ts
VDIKPIDVKKLRDQTGAGMMDCKTALKEAEGNLEKAVKILKEKGLAAAAKRSSRATEEGKVFTRIADGKAVILVLSCETDFVALNENFLKLGKNLIDAVIASGATEITDELNNMVKEAVGHLKENMELKKLKVLDIADDEYVVDYIHGVGNIGTLIKLKSDSKDIFANEAVKEFAFNSALHVAAFNPVALSPEAIDPAYMKEQEEIFTKQAESLDKPEKVLQGIIKGKLSKHMSEICLLNQFFVKDDKKKVAQVLADIAKAAGGKLDIAEYVYFKVGESA